MFNLSFIGKKQLRRDATERSIIINPITNRIRFSSDLTASYPLATTGFTIGYNTDQVGAVIGAVLYPLATQDASNLTTNEAGDLQSKFHVQQLCKAFNKALTGTFTLYVDPNVTQVGAARVYVLSVNQFEEAEELVTPLSDDTETQS
jgi:hypothetical protein